MKEKWMQRRRYYLSEFSFYDGDHYVTFNIVDMDSVNNSITVAVSNEGKISICTFDLRLDENDCLYFEYGIMLSKIAVDEFDSLKEEQENV